MFDSILDPTVGASADAGSGPVRLAPRPADLAGLRLGLLVNTKRNADLFLAEVGALLEQRYGITPVLTRTKPSIVHPAPPGPGRGGGGPSARAGRARAPARAPRP